MDRMTHGKDRGKCLLAASIALIFSAVLLVSGYTLLQPPASGDTAYPPAIEIDEKDFLPDSREGRRIPGGVQLDTPGRQRQVVVPLSRIGFEAGRYPVLHYHAEGWSPGLKIALYWRSTASPDTTRFIELPQTLLPATTLTLEHDPWWKGRITHLGFLLLGGIPENPVIIREVAFSSPTRANRIGAILSDWTTLQKWSMSSINSMADAAPHSRLSPTLAGASWAGLALLIYAGWFLGRLRGKSGFCMAGGLLLLVMIPWLMLHARWQLNLWEQLRETRQLYSGKSQEEKHQLAEDADIYRYANHLKNDLLPQAPARIIILRKNFRDHMRLKMQYYLLPHNSYNYDSFPQAAYLHDGDYILALGPIPGLHFIPGTNRLEWTGGRSIGVQRLDESPLGTLYRVQLNGEDRK